MNVAFLTSTRADGSLRARRPLACFLKRRRWPAAIATAEQIHGNRVIVVPKLSKATEYAGADGLLTGQARQPVGIFTADCLPVFLVDRTHGVTGVLHAGWRGVRARILGQAVRIFRRRWRSRPSQIEIWFGPYIGPCCFEVGWDVAKFFPRSRRRRASGPSGRWRVDLAQEVKAQAAALGLHLRRQSVRPCTMHGRGYFSFRRDKAAGRQISMIMRIA